MKFRKTLLSLAMALMSLGASASVRAGEPAAEARMPAAESRPADAKEKAVRCEPVAGSRIRATSASGCPQSPRMVRSYTKEQIQTTGEIDIAEALRKLDPIFY